MPTLKERIDVDLKDAMRRAETDRRDTIRLAVAAIKTEQQALVGAALDVDGRFCR